MSSEKNVLARLTVKNGDMQGQTFIMDKSSIVIGRKTETDVCHAHDTRLSRFHCQILQVDEGLYIEDLGSGNGTWVGGRRIRGRMKLENGMIFHIGDTNIEISIAFPEEKIEKKEEEISLHSINVRTIVDPSKIREVDTTTSDSLTVELL